MVFQQSCTKHNGIGSRRTGCRQSRYFRENTKVISHNVRATATVMMLKEGYIVIFLNMIEAEFGDIHATNGCTRDKCYAQTFTLFLTCKDVIDTDSCIR